MDHVSLVGVGHGVGDLVEQGQQVAADEQRLRPQQVVEGRSRNQLHRDEERAEAPVEVVDVDDPGVGQGGGGPGFALEAPSELTMITRENLKHYLLKQAG